MKDNHSNSACCHLTGLKHYRLGGNRKAYLCSIILMIFSFLMPSAQNIPNDTIFKKDGTKIIDDFKTITVHKEYLVTSKYELSFEKMDRIPEDDLKRIAMPLSDIDKVIDNGIIQKKRKFLNDNDRIWESESNTHKRNVWVHYRSVVKTVVLPNGRLKLLTLLVEGRCDLYIDFTITTLVLGTSNQYNIKDHHYYVYRKGEPRSTVFKGSREFIRTKKIGYFDDCPEAKEFIQTQKKLSQKEVVELVELYNANCNSI